MKYFVFVVLMLIGGTGFELVQNGEGGSWTHAPTVTNNLNAL